jgi:cellulose biosynthesis protein BcsQ
MTKIITVASIKGGVSKTVTALLLALHAGQSGKKVLFLDMDQQGSATLFLDSSADAGFFEQKNTAQMLMNGTMNSTLITKSHLKNVDFVGAHIKLVDLRAIHYKILSQIIRSDKWKHDYDLIIIDCPGTYDNHVESAIHAADYIITPFTATSFCYADAVYLSDKIEMLDKTALWHLLPTQYTGSLNKTGESTTKQYLDAFDETFSNIIPYGLPKNAAITKFIDSRTPLPKISEPGKKANITAKLDETFSFILKEVFHG